MLTATAPLCVHAPTGARTWVRWAALGVVALWAAGCRDVEPPYHGPTWEQLDKRPTPPWFTQAKFGVFIHWGVYSVPAWGAPGKYAEWYWHDVMDNHPHNVWREFHDRMYGHGFDYMDFAPRFSAELFDASAWADVLARSGARYVVLTTKHHDGYCLWPSAEANRTWGRPWNSVDVGPHRDLVAEVAEAVRARGMRFGAYYSLYEWFNPLIRRPLRYVHQHMIPQFKDMVRRYKPSLIFADGEGLLNSRQWRSEELIDWLFTQPELKDEIAINDRWGNDTRGVHGGYHTTEYAAGLSQGTHPWEESRGMAFSYGYNRAETADDYRSAHELLVMLADMVSRGGNLLLDIGPTADGRIPALMQDRLLAMGRWLKINGEAIYNTTMALRSCQWSAGRRPAQTYGGVRVPYRVMDQVGTQPKDGVAVRQLFFTRGPQAVYALAPVWPGHHLTLRGFAARAGARVTLLGSTAALTHRVEGSEVVVDLLPAVAAGFAGQAVYVFRLSGFDMLPEPSVAAGLVQDAGAPP